jgi:hypothetical protein
VHCTHTSTQGRQQAKTDSTGTALSQPFGTYLAMCPSTLQARRFHRQPGLGRVNFLEVIRRAHRPNRVGHPKDECIGSTSGQVTHGIGALLCRPGATEAPQGITPCRVVCSAGLRWCGGWRRTNLRGFHDQTQIEA